MSDLYEPLSSNKPSYEPDFFAVSSVVLVLVAGYIRAVRTVTQVTTVYGVGTRERPRAETDEGTHVL